MEEMYDGFNYELENPLHSLNMARNGSVDSKASILSDSQNIIHKENMECTHWSKSYHDLEEEYIRLNDINNIRKEIRDDEIVWSSEYTSRMLNVIDSIAELCNDFSYSAANYARIIISELSMDEDLKTIPVRTEKIGGLAGGIKYVANGILFKLCTNNNGLYLNDEAASKSANHELRACANVAGLHLTRLKLPLMVIIDYRGYRLLAVSLLPINESSLVYGSDNSASIVRNDDAEFESVMEQVAYRLNLKKHTVNHVSLHVPADCEGHRTVNGNMYLLDFQRMFPPEAIENFEHADKGTHLYKQLRPEFVLNQAVPLSSDAYSNFGQHNSKVHNAEVGVATNSLYSKVIPTFIEWMNDNQQLICLYPNKFSLTIVMHQFGINMRQLGTIYDSSNLKWKRCVLVEMVARSIKCIARDRIRSTNVQPHSRPSEIKDKQIIWRLLNQFVSSKIKKFKNKELNESTPPCWMALAEHVHVKFGITFENADSYLQNNIDEVALFSRLKLMLGFSIRMSSLCIKPWRKNDLGMELNPVLKHLRSIPIMEAYAIYVRGIMESGPSANDIFLEVCDKIQPYSHVFVSTSGGVNNLSCRTFESSSKLEHTDVSEHKTAFHIDDTTRATILLGKALFQLAIRCEVMHSKSKSQMTSYAYLCAAKSSFTAAQDALLTRHEEILAQIPTQRLFYEYKLNRLVSKVEHAMMWSKYTSQKYSTKELFGNDGHQVLGCYSIGSALYVYNSNGAWVNLYEPECKILDVACRDHFACMHNEFMIYALSDISIYETLSMKLLDKARIAEHLVHPKSGTQVVDAHTTALDILASAKMIVMVANGIVCFWSLPLLQFLGPLKDEAYFTDNHVVLDIALDDSDRIATISKDGSIRLWHVIEKSCLFLYGSHDIHLDFGRIDLCDESIVSVVNDEHFVYVWQKDTFNEPLRLKGHSDRVLHAIWLHSDHIASCSMDFTVAIWTICHRSCICILRMNTTVPSSMSLHWHAIGRQLTLYSKDTQDSFLLCWDFSKSFNNLNLV